MTMCNTAWIDVVAKEKGFEVPVRLRVQGRSMLPTLRPGDEVLVEPVSVVSLCPGDWIVLRGKQGGFLHRYLGMRDGKILTKGDSHAGFDPLWHVDAVLGRVMQAQRAGSCIYTRTPARLRRERLLAWGHRLMGGAWAWLRRLRALFLGLMVLVFFLRGVWAAVTVTDFYVEDWDDEVYISWTTASETGNLGFYIWRSESEIGEYQKIAVWLPGDADEKHVFIPSDPDSGIIGSEYEAWDDDLQPDTIYYYKVQDVPEDNSDGEFFGPVWPGMVVTPTVTPTVEETTGTVTLTPTLTSTPTPVPTATPHPNVHFWAEKTTVEAGNCTVIQWVTSNVKAVYLDSQGVVGEDSRTFCPCETETHTLYVSYPDGGAETFDLTLQVTGTCFDDDASTGNTATPAPTALPTATPQPILLTATATLAPVLTIPGVTQTPDPKQSVVTQSPSPESSPEVPMALSPTAPVEQSTTSNRAFTPTRPVVQGESDGGSVPKRLVLGIILAAGLVLGLGFISSGIWLWRHRQ